MKIILFIEEGAFMRLKIDTHVHSIVSGHAFSTIKEIADYSNENGIELVCIADHGPSMEGAPHAGYFTMMGDIPFKIGNCRILAGCECNIFNFKGELDLENSILDSMDIVLAGLHERTPYPENADITLNTNAVINAMKNPFVDIISHPFRSRFPVNMKEIVKAASLTQCILEVNCRVLAGNNIEDYREYRKMLELCLNMNVPVVIGTDAHIIYNIGNVSGLCGLDDLVEGCEKAFINEPEQLINILQEKRFRKKTL